MQVANGSSARDAWKACGEPGGEKGIQNIRKRGRAALKKKKAEEAALRVAAPPAQPPAQPACNVRKSGGRGNPSKNFRLSTSQLIKKKQDKDELDAAFNEVYADATQEYADLVSAGKTGKGQRTAADIANHHNERLSERDTRRLTARQLQRAVKEGRAGQARKKPGKASQVPEPLVKSLANYAQMQQIGGDEQGPRALKQTALAAVKGTRYEHMFSKPSQLDYLLRRVVFAPGSELHQATSCIIDDRRWNWLTSSNLYRWFEGYLQALHAAGFIDDAPDTSDVTRVVEIDVERARRMLNCDETHQKLSNEGEKSGSRATAYINPKLGRAGKRKLTYQRHATLMGWVNYAGEAGAPHLMLATGAAAAKKEAKKAQPNNTEETIPIRPEWTFGVPRVIGLFGHASKQVHEPSFIMNENGGMESGGLEQFIRCSILPAYPNMQRAWSFGPDGKVLAGPVFMQLDAGPDRLTECSLGFRTEMWERGLILFPGLPNGTAANQVMDALYGPYKIKCMTACDVIVSERIAARTKDPKVIAKLDFCDLGRIINGREGDDPEKRPFSYSFTPEKIISAVAKLGLNPVCMKVAMTHKRVRDDSMDGARGSAVTNLIDTHAAMLAEAKTCGLNVSPMRAAPRAVLTHAPFVAPPSSQEEQWKALKEAGTSVGTIWQTVGAKAFNSPDITGPALERLQERAAADRTKAAEKSNEFAGLQLQVRSLIEEMREGELGYDDLNVTELKRILNLVFICEKRRGVSKYTTKAACADFLNGIAADKIDAYLAQDAPAVPAVVASQEGALVEAVPIAPSLLQASRAEALVSASDPFAGLELALPGGMKAVTPAPEWVAKALAPDSDTIGSLVGNKIIYNWPPRLGGWSIGTVKSVDKGKGKKNPKFKVYYPVDKTTATTTLSATLGYASSSKAPVNSWALLV